MPDKPTCATCPHFNSPNLLAGACSIVGGDDRRNTASVSYDRAYVCIEHPTKFVCAYHPELVGSYGAIYHEN